jgi:peptidoglycan/LPS O-acetylase OafA/YrhL
MSHQFSLYLDLVRFFAALLVFVSHTNSRYLSQEIVPFSSHGHLAVMFFFVLSGFVIAYVTDTKEKTFCLYWSSRFSRIYSVAIPVVLLTPLIDYSGIYLSNISEIYNEHPGDYPWIRVISSLLFLNEAWFFSIMSFSNTPYWSLGYELPYYLIYSLAVFLKGKKRIWSIAIVSLFIGPKVLLLFPVWLMGVYLYKSDFLKQVSPFIGWMFFVFSIIFLVIWEYLGWTEEITESLKAIVGSELHKLLAFSKYFLGDWILGIVISINFVGFSAISKQFSIILDPCKKIIRFAASFTLSLYLFHQPLIHFYNALIPAEKGSDSLYWQTVIYTIITILLLGYFTELKRAGLRNWLKEKFCVLETRPFMVKILR